MIQLVAELGLETFPTYDEGENLLDFGGKRKRYRGEIPPLPEGRLADMAQAQIRFDRMAKRVPLEAPWAADRADEWDAETFETWIRRNARTASARVLLGLFSEAVFAAEPQDFSLLHALFYTHSGGGVNALVGVRNGAQQDRVVGGSQLIAAAARRARSAPARAARRAGAAHRAARRRASRSTPTASLARRGA